MRRAIVTVTTAAATFAAVAGVGGGLRTLGSLVHDGTASSAPHAATRQTTAYRPTSPTTVAGAAVDYGYGVLQLAVTFADHRLVDVRVQRVVTADGYSQALEEAAIPILTRELLASQGLPIDVVTGATYTSEAYALSLQAVLDREREGVPRGRA